MLKFNDFQNETCNVNGCVCCMCFKFICFEFWEFLLVDTNHYKYNSNERCVYLFSDAFCVFSFSFAFVCLHCILVATQYGFLLQWISNYREIQKKFIHLLSHFNAKQLHTFLIEERNYDWMSVNLALFTAFIFIIIMWCGCVNDFFIEKNIFKVALNFIQYIQWKQSSKNSFA